MSGEPVDFITQTSGEEDVRRRSAHVLSRASAIALLTLAACGGAERGQESQELPDATSEYDDTTSTLAGVITSSSLEVPITDTETSEARPVTSPGEPKEMILNGTVRFYDLDGLAPGYNPIITTQPNGDRLEVPRLDPSSPESLTTTALNLIACYVTIQDEACKDALGPAPEEAYELDYMAQELSVMTGAQLAIFSNPDNPAVFEVMTTDTKQTVVSLVGGELYLERLIDTFKENEWQGAWTREFVAGGGRDLVATEFRMNFRQEDENGLSPTGIPRLVGFEYSLAPARVG